MKNISSLIISSILTCGLFAQNCTELFISEYVEGSYNNKAIELYNPTNEALDLSKYSLSRWSNGSTTPLNTILSGTIEANDAFVIGLDKRDPDGEGYETPLWNGWYVFTDSISGLLDSVYTPEDDLMSRVDLFICPNYEDGTMYFNGNDAVTLETAEGDIIDVIGKIGEDPGEAWGDENDAYWTKDQTLIRKASVTGGFVYDPTQPYSFDPTLEWDSLPQNTFTYLGFHDCSCNQSDTIYGCIDTLACNFNPDAITDDGSCTFAELYYDCDGNCINDVDLDGICDEEDDNIGTIYGCIDTLACNFNPDAVTDDGSCTFAELYYDCDGNCINDVDQDGICDEEDDNIGITELSSDKPLLIKMIDILGREQKEHDKGVILFYIYENGQVEKRVSM